MTEDRVPIRCVRCGHEMTDPAQERKCPRSNYSLWCSPGAMTEDRVPTLDNETEACRHCPTPDVHPTRIGGELTYERSAQPAPPLDVERHRIAFARHLLFKHSGGDSLIPDPCEAACSNDIAERYARLGSAPSRSPGTEAAEWHRYLHAEGILVDEEPTISECGPWHHRVFLGRLGIDPADVFPPSRSEPLDLERLAEAWGNVMDGRRLGSERIGFSTTTYDDWKAIVAEYDRLPPSRSEPE